MLINQLIPGDILLRWKDPVWHMGIYMGDGQVLHNSPGLGEQVTPYNVYAAGQQVKASQPDSTKRAEIMQRAWEIMKNPQDYKHLTRNCEHTAYEVVEGKAKSPTVEKLAWIALITVTVGLVLVFRKEIAKALRSTGR